MENSSMDYSQALAKISSLPFVERSILDETILDDAAEISCAIFKTWKRSDLTVCRCTDGITNKLLKIENSATRQTVLVRCYGNGTSALINRHNELISICCLSSMNFAAPLYGRFENGICYGYVDGRVLTPKDIADPEIGFMIARKLACLHKIDVPVEKVEQERKSGIWETMKNWLAQVPATYSNPLNQTRRLAEPLLEMEFLRQELTSLEHLIRTTTDSPIVFCHNDLLAANIIMQHPVSGSSSSSQEVGGSSLRRIDSDENSLSGKICFIDFEYGSFSYRGFDIANHFNEYAGFDCDFSLFPSVTAQEAWAREYLYEYHDGQELQDSAVQDLVNEVAAFSLVSHFFWSIWAMVQAQVSDIDFDYIGYAACRLGELCKLKRELMARKEFANGG